LTDSDSDSDSDRPPAPRPSECPPSLKLPPSLRRVVLQQYRSGGNDPYAFIDTNDEVVNPDGRVQPIKVKEGLVWLKDSESPSRKAWLELGRWGGDKAFLADQVDGCFPLEWFAVLGKAVSAAGL